ncbi:MAG: hypothetical protein WDZ41_04590 [Candidatus Babeliales bacterium]
MKMINYFIIINTILLYNHMSFTFGMDIADDKNYFENLPIELHQEILSYLASSSNLNEIGNDLSNITQLNKKFNAIMQNTTSINIIFNQLKAGIKPTEEPLQALQEKDSILLYAFALSKLSGIKGWLNNQIAQQKITQDNIITLLSATLTKPSVFENNNCINQTFSMNENILLAGIKNFLNLNLNIDINATEENSGYTLLMQAIENDQKTIFHFLLDQPNIDINTKNILGLDACSCAIYMIRKNNNNYYMNLLNNKANSKK